MPLLPDAPEEPDEPELELPEDDPELDDPVPSSPGPPVHAPIAVAAANTIAARVRCDGTRRSGGALAVAPQAAPQKGHRSSEMR